MIDAIFIDFLLDSVGEILNQIARCSTRAVGGKVPILLRGCIGIGHSAATHHSGNYYAMFCSFPGLRVVVPSTPFDAKGLLLHALRAMIPCSFSNTGNCSVLRRFRSKITRSNSAKPLSSPRRA